jgi:D-3-phosphoglycerate dehydrogenase
MGSAFVSKVSSWPLDIVVYDKFKKLSFDEQPNIKIVCESEVWSKADIISIHVPYNGDTHHLINRANIDRCKDGVIIINSSRGAIVHTEDLVTALESGKVSGACLDVYENEKPNTYTEHERQLYSRLYVMDHVILSPHIAGWTNEALYKIADTIISKVRCLNLD